MKRSYSVTLSAALAAVSLFATPVLAQQREHGRSSAERQSEERATERAQPRTEQRQGDQARSQAPRTQAPRGVAPRIESRRQENVPRRDVAVPRAYAPRYEPRYSPRYSSPRYSARYVPFWQVRNYYRPYAFRPRFSIGFNIFAGYPVPYTYAYPYAYSVGRPAASYYGGVVLEIEPEDAAVYVDGAYAGVVGDFDGSRQPLTLTAGTHRIEVQEPGLAPLVFDVNVQPGQVIPYRGDLRPY
jgi:hypothetical protein